MNKNVPKLRFNGFSDEWRERKLGDLLVKSVATTKENSNIPVLTSSRRGLFLQSEYFNKEIAAKDTTGYNILPRGYFTYRHMSDDSTFHFNINKMIDKGLVSPEYPVFTTNKNLNSYFLYEYLNSSFKFSKFCKMQKKGGTRTRLYFKVLETYRLKIPSLQEQEKIADFFTILDRLIEEQDGKVRDLEIYKKGMMQKIFSQEIRFKDENGYDYPEWKEKNLKDICTINQGLQIAITDRFTEYQEDRYFYITNEFLKNDSDKKYYIENPPKNVICSKDDILMTRTGNTGNVVINVEGAFHNNFFRVGYQKDKVTKMFMYYFLIDTKTQKRISKLAGSSTIPDLNHSDFYHIKIQLPVLEEQNKVSEVLSNIDNLIEEEKKNLVDLREMKKGLLQKMFV